MASAGNEAQSPVQDTSSPPTMSGIAEKEGVTIEAVHTEHAAEQLNAIDFELLSRESIRFKSRATLRLMLVIFVQAISQ